MATALPDVAGPPEEGDQRLTGTGEQRPPGEGELGRGQPPVVPSGTAATPVGSRPGWHRARTGVSVALLGAAIAVIVLHGGTLARTLHRLTRVDMAWLGIAVVAEGSSMVVFGRLQQRLLRAGGSSVPLPTMVAITTASNAVTGTLPGGVGWAAAWLYDQLGSRGVPRFTRVWAFLVAGGVSSFALFLVIACGVEIAGPHGPVASLRWLAFLLAVVPLLALVVEVLHERPPVRHLVHWAEEHVQQQVPGGRKVLRRGRALLARFTAVRLGPVGWAEVLALALANWLFDCVVVVTALEGIGVRIPWRGILVVYGLTQISASLPITPGGIGIVDGSMTALLHAYGVPVSGALAGTLVYRIVSFWILVPIGWATWSALENTTRRRRARRRAVGAQLEAPPVPSPGGVEPAPRSEGRR